MKTIGLCMIVKDEAQVILRCLHSIRPLIDYVLIEDTGSTDGTQQIIRDYLQREGLAGEVFAAPWQDFAHNRSLALARLRENEDIDYAFIIDADDSFVPDAGFDAGAFKKGLSHDQYNVLIKDGPVTYHRPQICSNRHAFRYRGVLHEYLETPAGCSSGTADGFHIASRREGARSRDPDKYRKDAAVLERALAVETDPFLRSRYTFYLGQSYRDCGEKEKAVDAFLARADQGYWTEEAYIGLCYAARLQEALGRPFDEVFATFQRAAKLVPQRVEALHGACRLCRLAGRNREGYEVGKPGLPLPIPSGGLFVENWAYEYGLLDEFSVNAYWAGHYRESLDACLRLLGEARFPAGERQRIFANARFAAEKLAASPPQAAALDGPIASEEAAEQLPLPTPAITSARSSSQLVSVITPTRNRPAFLAAALTYFRNQDRRNLEWLILDDGERQASFEDLPETNIRYHHHAGPRLTIGEKRNRLVEQAKGEIIVHFDDDDFYAPNYVSTLVAALAQSGADLMNIRGWYLYDCRSDFFGYWNLMNKEGLHYCCDWGGVSLAMLKQENNSGFENNHLGYGFSYIYKREVWAKNRFPHKDFNEDGEFSLQAAAEFKLAGMYDSVGVCLHVLHPGSTSRCFPQYHLPGFQLKEKFPNLAATLRGHTATPAPAPAAETAARPVPVRKQAAPPIFIHSSWRTASTWFWSKFRELAGTTCFYEPFNTANSRITRGQAAVSDSRTWSSGHPPMAPYWAEYLPLIRKSGGIRLFDARIPFTWFMPTGGLRGDLRREECRYLALLLRHANRSGTIAVLGFSGSLGRAGAIKKAFGGIHVLQTRNLWKQWVSYVSYFRSGNTFFYETTPHIINSNNDPFFLALRQDAIPNLNNERKGKSVQLMLSLPEEQMFTLFMASQIYLYLHAELVSDFFVDATRLALDDDYRAGAEAELKARTGLPVSFSDARDELRHSELDFNRDAIDWDEIRRKGANAAEHLADLGSLKQLNARANEWIDSAYSEMAASAKSKSAEEVPGRSGSDSAGLATCVKKSTPPVSQSVAGASTGKVIRSEISGKPISFFVINENDIIQHHHARGEFYEMEELEIIRKHFNGGCFLDIGANVGNHAIFAAKFLNASRVICIEPNPAAIDILRMNIELNGLGDVIDQRYLGVGLAGASGMADLNTPYPNNLGGMRLIPGTGEVRLAVGDELLHAETPQFVKIDVEGMELAVLTGMRQLIARSSAPIFVEVDNGNRTEFFAWIEKHGYVVAESYRRYARNENFLLVPASSPSHEQQ